MFRALIITITCPANETNQISQFASKMAAAAAAGAVSQSMGPQSSGAPPPGAQQVINEAIVLGLLVYGS